MVMTRGLKKLIRDYKLQVADAVSQLEASGISRPTSLVDWVTRDIPQTGTLADGSLYFKHGYGCAVRSASGAIDFDFGENGEIDGFEPHRLSNFAGKRLVDYGFRSERDVKSAVARAEAAGHIRFSGDILYYVAHKGAAR